jgi:prepilin-type N-terminal cleavage/methylation domain-containing protein
VTGRRAFTLLEVLISVAIIAILIGLLLPMLLRGRAASQQTVCASNLRQVGTAFQAYLHEHRMFPRASMSPDWHYGGAEFAGFDRRPTLAANRPLNSVVSDRLPDASADLVAIFRCPADRGVWRVNGGGAQEPIFNSRTCFDVFGTSYRANDRLVDSTAAGIDDLHRPLGENDVTVGPSRLLVVGDAVWKYATLSRTPSADPASALDASWHMQSAGGNMAAMDGSVRFVRFTPHPSAAYTLVPRQASAAD